MKIFCYFVEPALYTLDLASNIHEKYKIDYCFIKSTTFNQSTSRIIKDCLDKMSSFSKIKYVYNIYRNHDMIIVNGYNNYPFIFSYLFQFFSVNKKYIAIESDTQFTLPNNPFVRLVKWVYLSVIFRNQHVLGFSGGSQSHKNLFRNYGMKEDRIFLMPMMVNNSRFYCDNKVFPDLFTFLYVGRLVEHKGVEELINEFNRNFINKKAILKIVGSGKREKYLKNKYESNKIIFLGKKTGMNLIKEFHSASCFVCPSKFEPWGLVVNEALSASLVVIATKQVGACSDLIQDKKTGFVAEDIHDFGKKMLKVYTNKEILSKYSYNARKIMQEEWNYSLYLNCLKDAIDNIESWE